MRPFCFLTFSMGLLISGCSEEFIPTEADRLVKTERFSTAAQSSTLTYPGTLEARYQSQLSFQVGGQLRERNVEPGSRLTADQVIATLDTRDYQLGTANLAGLKQAAEADHQRAARDLRRARQLITDGFIGESQLDIAINAEAASRARLNALQAQHGESVNRLAYTELKAPNEGVVTAVYAEVGDVLSPGEPVVTLAWLNDWEFVSAIPETHIGSLELGQSTRVNFWSLARQPVEGVIREIAPAADPASRSYAVKISFTEIPDALRLGMTGSIEINDPAQLGGALPTSALLMVDNRKSVLVIDEKSQTTRLQPVTLGPPVGDQVTITSGLSEGDRVIVAGANKVVPGSRVRLAD